MNRRHRLAPLALPAFALALIACGPEDAAPALAGTVTPASRLDVHPELAAPTGTLFVDVGEAWGIDHERAEVDPSNVDRIAAGVCPIDVDGEPPLDLLFTRRAGDGGSVLYVGRGPGDYVEEAAARGLDPEDDALGCLAFDADADGDQDLLLMGVGLLRLYTNDGGSFEAVPGQVLAAFEPGTIYISGAAGDLDGDEDVDLFVGGMVIYDPSRISPGLDEDCGRGLPCRFEAVPRSPHAPNLLLIQDEEGVYQDRAAFHPGGIDNPLPTLVTAVVDVDRDGILELIAGNDFTYRDMVYWRGPSGDAYFERGEDFGLGIGYRGVGIDSMGWTTGDLDGDEIPDHVVTGFHDQASMVHVSGGDTEFEDVGPDWGMLDRIDTLRWASGLGDFDLDGDLDLVEATGHIYPVDRYETNFTGDERQPTNYFAHDGERLVAVDPLPTDALSLPTDSRGMALVDLDDDGRLDLVQADVIGPGRVFRNATRGGHWLRIRLEGAGSNPEAIGAQVRVVDGAGRVFVRDKKVGEGYAGNFDPRLHVGLPDAGPVDVEVRWPDGVVTTEEGVEIDREVTLAR